MYVSIHIYIVTYVYHFYSLCEQIITNIYIYICIVFKFKSADHVYLVSNVLTIPLYIIFVISYVSYLGKE